MVGDIFVCALIVISGCINLLAIGAFWVTPSLRTTANRFVINLLIVNFISCLILSPFAFNVSENSSLTNVEIASFAKYNDSESTAGVVKVDNHALVNTTTVECSNQTRECLDLSIQIVDTLRNKSANDELSYDNKVKRIENFLMKKYQSWSLDFVVALSVLSVLLVVMDTFIAVTDPLRYHSRISDLKAWFLIAFCWIFGVSFGVASALRTSVGEMFLSSNFEQYIDNNLYNTMFLLSYFLLIIITPCLLVSLMYWRIYSEARENGQRMRQNGSSPLLQSALNLAATATANQHHTIMPSSPQCLLLVNSSPQTNRHQQHQHYNSLNKQQTADNGSFFHQLNQAATDGLTMKIDKQDYYGVTNNNINQQINLNNNNHLSYVNSGAFNDTKTFLLSSPPHELIPMLNTIDETTSTALKSQQHQNILLTLTTACDPMMKRNHSAKHLPTEASLYDDVRHLELRQVQSTPNFQEMTESTTELMIDNHQEQTLELPSIQASPKTLRYKSLRHRLSNASSLFKYREEGRAARISILGKLRRKEKLHSKRYLNTVNVLIVYWQTVNKTIRSSWFLTW